MWTETQAVAFDGGFFSVQLGASTPFGETVFDSDELFLGVRIGTSPELSPRVALNSVPFALRAEHASAVTGPVNATEVMVGSTTIIGADGMIDFSALKNVPPQTDTLAALSCGAGQIAAFNGSAWACRALEIDASGVVSGTIAIGRLPVGNSAGQVAAGDHAHEGVYAPVAHDHDGAYVEVGDVYSKAEVDDLVDAMSADPNFSGTLTADAIATPGTVKLGGASATCNTAAAGALRYSTAAKIVQYCDGTGWRNAGPVPLTGSGTAASPFTWVDGNPARTCKDYKTSSPAYVTQDGVYKVDPDGSGAGAPFDVYCEETAGFRKMLAA